MKTMPTTYRYGASGNTRSYEASKLIGTVPKSPTSTQPSPIPYMAMQQPPQNMSPIESMAE